MSIKYNVVEIFTSEDARWQGKPVWDAIVAHVRKNGIAARCVVSRGIAGCYENGEIASNRIEILSFNMPIKIDIILPKAELETLLPGIEEIVTEGIVAVKEMDMCIHKTNKRLIPRQLRIKDAMTSSPVTITDDTSVSDIIKILLSNDFNALPVIDSAKHPIGIITQGDLISRAAMPIRLGLLEQLEEHKVEEYLQSVSQKKAAEVMTKPVVTIHENNRLGDAADLMLKHHLKRIPVVNEHGEIAGIIARSDIFHAIAKETPDWQAIKEQNVLVSNIVLVRDIMQRDTQTIKPDAPIEEVIKLIAESKIQRIAVVDNNGKLLGLISDSLLIGQFSEHRAGLWDYFVRKLPFTELARKHKEFIEQTQAKTASDIMLTDMKTVKENTRIEDAIKLMSECSIKRLPVVNDEGIFEGLISRDSVLRAGVKIQK